MSAAAAGRTRGGRALIVPCAAILAVYVVVFAAPQLVQSLVDDEGLSRSEAGLLMTAFGLAYCAGGIPAGRLTRRLGSGRVLLLGTALAGVAAVGCAASPFLPALVGLRLLVGFATALVLTAGILRAVEALPAERQAAGIGWITVSAYVGVGTINLIAPPLVGPLGWRGVFLLTGVAALATALALARSARAPVSAPVARGGGAPLRSVLRDRRLLLVYAMLFLALAALYGPLAWIPSFMEDVAGLSEADRSLAGAVIALAAIPGAAAAGLFARRTGRPALTAGLFLALCAPIALLALDAGARLPVLVVVAALLVAGATGSTLPLFALAPACVDDDARETAAGLATTIGLGGTVVATQTGALLIDLAGYPAAFIVFGCCGAVGALLAFPLARELAAGPPAR